LAKKKLGKGVETIRRRWGERIGKTQRGVKRSYTRGVVIGKNDRDRPRREFCKGTSKKKSSLRCKGGKLLKENPSVGKVDARTPRAHLGRWKRTTAGKRKKKKGTLRKT